MSELNKCTMATPDIFPDDTTSNLSMRDKSLLKRSLSKHHNNNFKSGYIPVNHQDYVQKTGLRGRKTFAFWTLVGLLFVLAVGNLILTMTILGVLKLGQGMQALELVPERDAIKFYGNTEFQDIYKRDGLLEGFNDIPVELDSENGSIILKLLPRNGRSIVKFTMDRNGTTVHNTESFDVRDKFNKAIFSTTAPTYNIVNPVNSFESKITQTSRIVAPISQDLHVESKTYVNVKGAEGVSMEGKEIVWSADQHIYLKSINGSILLSGKEGTFIDMKKIPIIPVVSRQNEYVTAQYKVCVCMPQGKLFRIPVPKDYNSRVFCNHINSSQQNPCTLNS